MTSWLDGVGAELHAAMRRAAPGLAAANELCTTSTGLLGVDGAAVSMVLGGASRGTFGSSGEVSRRLDEYHFTYGEGPSLDAVSGREAVLVPDLDSPTEHRWPGFSRAVLAEGIRGVFALPIVVASVCVGALDLFRNEPGPLLSDQLAGALLTAKFASLALVDGLVAQPPDDDASTVRQLSDRPDGEVADGWDRLVELDRIEVYQATGMLISQLDVDPTEALLRLRAHAIATGQTASEVAWAIIERRLVLDRDERGHPGAQP